MLTGTNAVIASDSADGTGRVSLYGALQEGTVPSLPIQIFTVGIVNAPRK